ncbi:flagellar brake protein [Helicovermis profundi]|uniref:PilZ domain-containing protein n=1 Tax=Helicovermis profundi TaxID=3065157 RepID=A0AAU9E575_9FIRM|nr:hypothetical protein HLPR_21150 [Clostridia bacterium S502]
MELKTALITGMLIDIDFFEDGKNSKFKTIVDRQVINGTFTVFTPMHKGKYYVPRISDKVKITFLFNDTEKDFKKPYSFTASIIDRKKSKKSSYLVLKVISKVTNAQRRQSFRLSVVNSIEFEHNIKKGELLTKDISSTGMKCILPYQIKAKEEMKIFFPYKNTIIEIYAHVVDSFQIKDSISKYEARLKFIDTNEATISKISNFLLSKQAEEIRSNLDSKGYSELYKLLNFEDEKRREDDINIRMVNYLAFFSWFIFFIILLFFFKARPKIPYGVQLFFNMYYGSVWNLTSLNIALVLSILQFSLTAYGLSINSTRMKRASDRYSISLIINLILSIVFFIIYSVIIRIIQ